MSLYVACRVRFPIVSANCGLPVTVTPRLQLTHTVMVSPAPYVPPLAGVEEIETAFTVGTVPCGQAAGASSRRAKVAMRPGTGGRCAWKPSLFSRPGDSGTLDSGLALPPPPPAQEILEKRVYRTLDLRHRSDQASHAASVRKKTLHQTSDHHDFSLCGTRIALGPRHSSRAMRIAMVSNLECSISALPPIPDRSRGFLPATGLRPTWRRLARASPALFAVALSGSHDLHE